MAAIYEQKLEPIGFVYGACKSETIRGEISWLEINYSDSEGVTKLSFADESRVWNFGVDVDGAETQRIEFGDNSRWIGLHGS